MKRSQEIGMLALLAALQFVHIVDFMMVMPLAPRLNAALNLDAIQFSWIVAAYTLAAGLSGLLATLWLDRVERRAALLMIFTGFLGGTLACGLADDYITLLAARMLTGAFGGLMSAMTFSIIADAVPAERRALAMGVVMTAFSLASIVGLPLGLYVARTFDDWRAPFLVLAGLGVLLLPAARLALPVLRRHLVGNRRNGYHPLTFFREIAKEPTPRRGLMLMLLLIFSQFAVIPLLSDYLTLNADFTEDDLALMYALGGGATLVTGPLIGRLADRLGKSRVFTVMAVVSIVPLVGVTHLGGAPFAVALVFTTLFMVSISGRSIPAVALVSGSVEAQRRGRFMSLVGAVQQLAAAAAALLAGMVVHHAPDGRLVNYNYVGYAAAVFTVAALAVRIGAVRKE